MKIIKRNSSEETFDIGKIINAVTKANNASEKRYLTNEQINDIAEYVEYKCGKLKRAVSVEEIQDMVERLIMEQGKYEVAKNYITYRYTRELARRANTTDKQIFSLIDCNNEEVKQEMQTKTQQ